MSPGGATVEVTGWTEAGVGGKIAEVQYRTTPSGSANQKREFTYTTIDDGTEAGLQRAGEQILWENHAPGTPDWNEVRKVTYDYYADGDGYGLPGDLRRIVTQQWDPTLSGGSGDWAGNDTSYFRYYIDGANGKGFAHGLERVVLANSYDSLAKYATEHSTTVDELSEAVLNSFTCFYYEYDADHRVSKSVVFGQSNESDFVNNENPNNNPKGYNNWYRESIETRLDGSTNTVYTNFIGQTLLTDLCDSSGNQTVTYNRYDENGRLIFVASPSAFVLDDEKYYDDSLPDLIDFGSGDSPYLNDDGGQFRIVTYYDSTTSNIGETVNDVVVAGGVKGYPHQTAVAEGEDSVRIAIGESGGPTLLASYEYIARWDGVETTYADAVEAGASIIYPVASKTVYSDIEGTNAIVTSYDYSWYDTQDLQLQVKELLTTLPVVTTDQNGSDHTSTTKVRYDDYGHLTWSSNELGRVTYTQCDPLTGLVEYVIDDIDGDTVDALSLTVPDGWELPETDGAHEKTDFMYDSLGRVTQVLGPEHLVDLDLYGTWVRSATWTFYLDADHETRSAQGYAVESIPDKWDDFTIVGPVSITKTDLDGRVTNQIQASYTGDVEDLATAEILQSDYTAWTAYQYKKTKLWKTAVYYDIPSSSTVGSDDFVGDKDVNFNMTVVGYESYGETEYGALAARTRPSLRAGRSPVMFSTPAAMFSKPGSALTILVHSTMIRAITGRMAWLRSPPTCTMPMATWRNPRNTSIPTITITTV